MEQKKKYIQSTEILDFNHILIQDLIRIRKWKELNDVAKIKEIYTFVRDEVKFGYNVSDDIAASQVLKDGYGQCNTKAILLMAILRAVEIPNRIHGFTINKELQKGAITGIWYVLSPKEILHSWVEVFVNEEWYILEGVILDKPYLENLQAIYNDCKTTFCGFGVYTDNFQNPEIDWNLNNTYIQDKGISQDFGLFDTPDEFYSAHRQQLNPVKQFFFKYIVRFIMNRNVNKIRKLSSKR